MTTAVHASWIEDGFCPTCEKIRVHNFTSVSSGSTPMVAIDKCRCSEIPLYVTDVDPNTKIITISTEKPKP